MCGAVNCAVVLYIWGIFTVPEVIHITCNTGALDLPDMYVLSLPLALRPAAFRQTCQANSSC